MTFLLYLLIVLHVIICLFLILVVLLVYPAGMLGRSEITRV